MARRNSPSPIWRNGFSRFFECERLDRRRFATQVEARLAVSEFVERWYNPHRRHSALDYESPVSYEKKHQRVA